MNYSRKSLKGVRKDIFFLMFFPHTCNVHTMVTIYDYIKWKSCGSGEVKKETKNIVCERVRSRSSVV